METLMKADIFFFITSVAVIVLALLTAALLYYLIKAGKNLYSLTETIKNGVKESEEFIADIKDRFDSNMILRMFFPSSRRRRKAATREESDKTNI